MIIFDMDGVLFDSVTIAENAFLEDYPYLTKNHLKELLTGNIHEEIEKFKLNYTAVIRTEEEKESRRLTYSQQKLEVGMYEGMLELLKFLKQKGYILTINSSALERNLLPLLEKACIRDMFDWVASAEVSRSKFEKFNMIEEKYQLKKEDMLFITDTLGDIREADRAKIPTVGVLWGSHDESFITRELHENLKGIVSSPTELQDFILEYYE